MMKTKKEVEMNYVPLRVYSVFSRGKGAVDAAALGGYAKANKIPALAVTDPFAMTGWEHFKHEADSCGLRPLLGMEVKLHHVGSILLFPRSLQGYFSLVASYNNKTFSKMNDMAAVLVPDRNALMMSGDTPMLMQVREQVGAENFYLGLEWHSKRWLVEAALKHQIPLVWAQPLKWVDSADKFAVASAVFNHHPIPDLMESAGSGGDLSLYGPIAYRAIAKRWGDTGKQAMSRTFEVAEKVEFTFEKLFQDEDSTFSRLEETINCKLREKRPVLAERERAYRELKIIKDMGFSPYFLIAAEIGEYCRQNRIYFNLRGSGVSSYLLYLLGMSRVNPLNHNLLFERFVNSLRDDLPDIDIDMESSRRGQLLRWVFDRYKGKVAFVSTHKFFGARSALYEVARTFGFSPDDAHGMSKEMPMFASPRELEGKGSGKLKEVYRWASLLEGVYKELSLHVGGVVFAAGSARSAFPLEQSPAGFDQVIWDKNTIERLNIYKLDLLGVRGFDVISPVALEEAQSIDFQDPAVWENIKNAGTVGCFQLESPLARKNLTETLPQNVDELGISIAIIRPGPAKSGMKAAYIEKRAAFHPLFEEIFPHTRGTLIFEEQISLLLYHITGWNLEFCEKVRRTLKKRRGTDDYRAEFFEKGKRNGWRRQELDNFWKIACDFSLYAFNHAHSISYAYSAYLSAWFKTHRPRTFFCRLLNGGGGYYPLPVYIEEAKRWGVRFLPPDINLSKVGFCEEEDGIRTGLILVKGIGQKLALRTIQQRGIGYASIEDFIGRAGAGERELSVLMAVSAFSSFGYDSFSSEEKEKNWKEYLGFVPGAPAGAVEVEVAHHPAVMERYGRSRR